MWVTDQFTYRIVINSRTIHELCRKSTPTTYMREIVIQHILAFRYQRCHCKGTHTVTGSVSLQGGAIQFRKSLMWNLKSNKLGINIVFLYTTKVI